MKICLVTTFPPSTGGLSEYGFHIAQQLQRNPFLSLTVLADELPPDHTEPEGFTVVRCWSFDDLGSGPRLLQDVASSEARRRLVQSSVQHVWTQSAGRLLRPYDAVARTFERTLYARDAASLDGHGGTQGRGSAVTKGYTGLRARCHTNAAASNSVSVLMPGYRKILNDKYGRDNVHLRAHGILARRPEFPDFARRGNPIHRILAFGKWGTYKRLELMIEAFNRDRRAVARGQARNRRRRSSPGARLHGVG